MIGLPLVSNEAMLILVNDYRSDGTVITLLK